MSDIRKIQIISRGNIFRTMFSAKIYIALFLAYIIFSSYVEKIKEFSETVGIKINGWILPYITSYKFAQVAIVVGVVFIFGDMPFNDISNEWQIVRVGRKNWIIGKILFIYKLAWIMAILYYLISLITLIPQLQFEFRWGKILGTLAQMNTGGIVLNYNLQIEMTPIEACLISIVMIALVNAFTGMIIMMINMLVKIAAGQLAGLCIAFLAMLAPNFSNLFAAYYFSPASWLDISFIISGNISKYPTAAYIFTVIGSGIIFLSAACIFIAINSESVMIRTK